MVAVTGCAAVPSAGAPHRLPGSPASAENAGAAVLDRGVAAFRRKAYAEAAQDLERAHAADPADDDVTLLLGIADYYIGRESDAESLLEAAIQSRDEETAAGAQIFLGLIASERGDVDAARSLFDAVSGCSSPELARRGRYLLRRSTPRPLTLALWARTEFDSNVSVLPLTANPNGSEVSDPDFDALVLASATFRPWSDLGISIRETASYRQQLRLYDFDIFSNTLTAGYDYLGSWNRFGLSEAFQVMTLGPSLYTLASVAEAKYRRRVAGDFGVALDYAFRYATYYPPDYAPYTGPYQTGILDLSWGTPDQPLEVDLGAVGVREVTTTDPDFTAWGGGGRLYGRARLGGRTDLEVAVWAIGRTFDAVPRQDLQLYGDLSLAIDLSSHFTLVLGATVLRNASTDSNFDYLKWTGYVGLGFGYAGPTPQLR